MIRKLTLLSLTLYSVVKLAYCAPLEDLVTDLPGQPHRPLEHRHYAGYLDIGNGTHIFYQFFESHNKPRKDPLILWMQGGLAFDGDLGGMTCTSGNAIMNYLGPWNIVGIRGTLVPSNFTWVKFSNMLFIDYGQTNGFSYMTRDRGRFDDYTIANSNRETLKQFFLKFPEYSRHDLYLFAESRGFTIASMLVDKILDDHDINFKGMYALSGISSEVTIPNTIVPYFYYHGLIGKEYFQEFMETCCGEDKFRSCQHFVDPKTPECSDVVSRMSTGLDLFYIYGECVMFTNTRSNSTEPQSSCATSDSIKSALVTLYLNRRDVRKALHVSPHAGLWTGCSFHPEFEVVGTPVMPIVKRMMAKGKRVMLTYADADSLAPIQSEVIVDDEHFQVTNEYQPWYYPAEDGLMRTGGFFQNYQNNLTYAIVMNTGHVQATNNPRPVFHLVRRFLHNLDQINGVL